MIKEESVINFYLLCNKLKNTIRTGWVNWNVSKDRLESIAEHIFSTQMLALSIKSEYNYDIDIMKVIYMLAIHELGESVIGDITMFQMSSDEKEKIEHEAVHKILKGLVDGEKIEELFLEFDSHKTKESLFAFYCDKLDADLQAKLYDEEGYVDLNNQESNDTMNHPKVKELLEEGNTFGEMWMKFSLDKYPYDDNFKNISEYVIKNKILKK